MMDGEKARIVPGGWFTYKDFGFVTFDRGTDGTVLFLEWRTDIFTCASQLYTGSILFHMGNCAIRFVVFFET
jgi:hypothetical protein